MSLNTCNILQLLRYITLLELLEIIFITPVLYCMGDIELASFMRFIEVSIFIVETHVKSTQCGVETRKGFPYVKLIKAYETFIGFQASRFQFRTLNGFKMRPLEAYL